MILKSYLLRLIYCFNFPLIIIYFNKNPSNLLRSIQKFLKNNFYKEIILIKVKFGIFHIKILFKKIFI